MAQLDAEQWQQWNTNGYFILRNVFSPAELDALRPPSNAEFKDPAGSAVAGLLESPLFKQCVVFGSPLTDEDPNVVVKLEGLGRLAPLAKAPPAAAQAPAGPASPGSDPLSRLLALHALSHHPKLSGIAKELLGPGAQLSKDKYIFKQAGGGGGFIAHQDMTFIYNRVATDMVNFGIAFNDADAENGSLEVAPGLERQLRGKHILPTTETKMPDGLCDGVKFEHTQTRTGDVIVFSAWVLHRSTVNQSDRDRAVYYVTYGARSDATPPLVGSRGSIYEDYYEMHRAWIEAGYPQHTDADHLLGPERPRPSLIPKDNLGFGVDSLQAA